jgi:hypothetical protein
MAQIPAEMLESKKVQFLLLGKEILLETAKQMKAEGFDGNAIGGVAQGLGAAVAGAFQAYGAADSAAIVTFKKAKK